MKKLLLIFACLLTLSSQAQIERINILDSLISINLITNAPDYQIEFVIWQGWLLDTVTNDSSKQIATVLVTFESNRHRRLYLMKVRDNFDRKIDRYTEGLNTYVKERDQAIEQGQKYRDLRSTVIRRKQQFLNLL